MFTNAKFHPDSKAYMMEYEGIVTDENLEK